MEAYETLAATGKIEISLAPFGENRTIRGDELRNCSGDLLRKILTPTKVVQENPQDQMSASDFRAAHPELEQKGRSAFEERAMQQAVATFLVANPQYSGSEKNRKLLRNFILKNGLPRNAVQSYQAAFDALVASGELVPNADQVVSGEVVRVTQYEPQTGGYPQTAKIDKASFRNLVENMSAAELAERCRVDSKFKEALDNL